MSMFSFDWNQKSPLMRFIGAMNLLLAVMVGFSALLSMLIVAVNANPHPQRFIFYALLLTVTAASGFVSGVNLVREKPAKSVTFLFGLLLAIFVVTDVVMEQLFPLRLGVVLVYGLSLCGISLRIPMSVIRDAVIPAVENVKGSERSTTIGK